MTTNAGRRSALNMISSFDCYGIFPSGKWKNTYFRKQESLNGEFKQFIEHVKDNSSGNGLSDNYNLRCIAFLQQFLLYLQDLGISTFLEVQSICRIQVYWGAISVLTGALISFGWGID